MLKKFWIDPEEVRCMVYLNYMIDEMETEILKIIGDTDRHYVEYEENKEGFHYLVNFVDYYETIYEDLVGYLEGLGFVEEKECPW